VDQAKRPHLGKRFLPLGAYKFDNGHSLARGLNAAFFFGLHATRDFSPYVNHIFSITGSVPWAPSPMGNAVKPSDNLALLKYTAGGVINSGPISHVMWIVMSGPASATICGTDSVLITDRDRDELASGKWSAENLKRLAEQGIDPGPAPRAASYTLSIALGSGSPGAISVLQQSAVYLGGWSPTIAPGQLYQIVVTYDPGTNLVYGYINGTSAGTPFSGSGGFRPSPNNINFLCSGDPGDLHWNGNFIQFRSYNRTLSAREVAQDYADPFALIVPVRRRKIHIIPSAAPPAGKRPRITVIA
jgi:hypothetical protein